MSFSCKRLHVLIICSLVLSIDFLLLALFSLSIKVWVLIILWFIMAPVAHRWDVGPLYVSILVLFFLLPYLLDASNCAEIGPSSEP